MNRYDFKRILYGMIFLAIGGGYLGDQFSLWQFTILFPGSWILLIIVPLGIEIIIGEGNIWFCLIELLGLFYLVSVNQIIDQNLSFSLVIGLASIAIGLRLVFRRKYKNDNKKEDNKYEYEYKFTKDED